MAPTALGGSEPAVFLKPKGLPTRGEQLILVIEDGDDDVKKPIRNPLNPSSKKRSPTHSLPNSTTQGCQMAVDRFFKVVCVWPFGLEGLWLRFVALQNLIPSFPWIATPPVHPGAIQGKEGIKFCHLATLLPHSISKFPPRASTRRSLWPPTSCPRGPRKKCQRRQTQHSGRGTNRRGSQRTSWVQQVVLRGPFLILLLLLPPRGPSPPFRGQSRDPCQFRDRSHSQSPPQSPSRYHLLLLLPLPLLPPLLTRPLSSRSRQNRPRGSPSN